MQESYFIIAIAMTIGSWVKLLSISSCCYRTSSKLTTELFFLFFFLKKTNRCCLQIFTELSNIGIFFIKVKNTNCAVCDSKIKRSNHKYIKTGSVSLDLRCHSKRSKATSISYPNNIIEKPKSRAKLNLLCRSLSLVIKFDIFYLRNFTWLRRQDRIGGKRGVTLGTDRLLNLCNWWHFW